MEVLQNSCSSDESGEVFVYSDLPKEKPQDRHPIPGTPFAFYLTFVYDPLLSYDFVVLKIRPEEDLLRDEPNKYRSPDLYYKDRNRRVGGPTSELAEPSASPAVESGDNAGFMKRTFGIGSLANAALLAGGWPR